MKRKYAKSLLPKKASEGVALNQVLLKIKPRFPRGFIRLKNIFPKLTLSGLTAALLLGYYPVFTFPPTIKQHQVRAEEPQQEVIAEQLPEAFSLPHPGYISQRFTAYHPGLDIATGLGMPIHPISSGVVEEIIFGFLGYGNHVYVSHTGGFKSMYAHMGRIYVKRGQTVTTENILGEVGISGFTSGPHTHLEITRNNINIDPQTLLPPLPNYPIEGYNKPFGGSSFKLKSNLRKTLKPDFN